MSCEATSWINLTVKEATDMLAKRAAVGRALRKRADMNENIQNGLSYLKSVGNDARNSINSVAQSPDVQKSLSALQRQIQLNPALASGLGGAAIGAGVGGLSAAVGDKPGASVLGSALTGAMGGGALGTGAYMATRMAPEIKNRIAEQGGSGSNSVTYNGKNITLDKNKIMKNPGVINEIERLNEPSTATSTVGAITGGIGDYVKNHPILSTLMAGDAFSNAAGTIGESVSGLPGQRANVFMEGVRRLKGDGEGKHLAENIKQFYNTAHELSPADIEQMLHDARSVGANGHVNFTSGGKPSSIPVSELTNIYRKGRGSNPFTMGGMQSLQDMADHLTSGFDGKLSIGDPKSRTKWLGDTVSSKGKVLKAMGGSPGATSWKGHLLPRLALYAGVPLLQSYMGLRSEESRNTKRLDDLVKQLQAQGAQ